MKLKTLKNKMKVFRKMSDEHRIMLDIKHKMYAMFDILKNIEEWRELLNCIKNIGVE